MKILYLYAEVMGYTMATIFSLVERGAEVHVVHWDDRKLTPYVPPSHPRVYMYKRSEMGVEDIHRLVDRITPVLTVVSGWQDKGYLAVSRRLRAMAATVVTGFDDQWHGTLRQRIAGFLGSMGYFSRFFSHSWVSGAYQFEYARRLGFLKQQIIFDLYSADLKIFHEAYRRNQTEKSKKYPHRFLFVGRLEPIKGLDTLVQAWQLLQGRTSDWELHLIGNGSQRDTFKRISGLVIKDFMQPDELMHEVNTSGCFILPSRGEPWGVVVHEFAAAGMPLIVSNVVGAASTFLISGMNGFVFEANNSHDLARQMARVIGMSDRDLCVMSEHSYRLSQRITPETSAGNLLSLKGE